MRLPSLSFYAWKPCLDGPKYRANAIGHSKFVFSTYEWLWYLTQGGAVGEFFVAVSTNMACGCGCRAVMNMVLTLIHICKPTKQRWDKRTFNRTSR